MQLTSECLKALKSHAFWESTDTPSLYKYLKFRLHEGNLEAEETEHLRYNSDLNIISEYYSELSEIGQKVPKWKQDFKNDKSSNQINHFWDLQVKRHNVEMETKLLEAKNKLLMKEQDEMETQICLEQTHHILDVTRDTREQGLLLRRTITNKFERRVLDDSLELGQKRKKKNLSLSKNKESKKAKTTDRKENVDDNIDDPFISNNRAINLAESSDFSKDNYYSSSSSSIRGSVSFDNPFDNQSQDLNNSTIPGSETESINVFNSISSEAKDHESDDDFMPIQPKQKRNLSLPKKADDDKDPKSTDSSSKQRRKFVLEWNLYEDLKQIVTEWTIDDTNISEAFFRFKSFAESKADRYELKFSGHPGEILALNSILLLEENSVRVQLNISSAIRTKIFEQMRAIYPKYDLPKVVEDMSNRCAQVARKQTREALEEEIDNAYSDLRTNSSPSDKKLLRISHNVWNHIAENWRTSFDSPRTIEDTHVHHSIHPFLRPFFPDGPDRTVDWANKLSFVSASRKTNDNDQGEGHKPDFTITVNKRSGKFEVVFGLFKSPCKSSCHFANVDLVDLGVLMKDSLDNMYKEKRIELDMAVFGIHAFGYNVRVYAMDLSYDAVYRMYLMGEFELPKSNISLCLVENALYEVENLKNFVEEYIERLPSYTTNNDIIRTPTEKMRMIRKTVATPRKVELKLGDV